MPTITTCDECAPAIVNDDWTGLDYHYSTTPPHEDSGGAVIGEPAWGKVTLTIGLTTTEHATVDDARGAFNAWCDEHTYWPDLFHVDERGFVSRIDPETGCLTDALSEADEMMQRIESTLEILGWLTPIGDADEPGCFNCAVCDGIQYGGGYLFET